MSDFLGVITPDEIEVLRKAKRPGIIHPVVSLADACQGITGKPEYTAATSELAGRMIIQKDPKWLRALRPRLLAVDDFTHASSALGQIRAYYALIETWLDVRPAPIVANSKVSPEFQVDAGDGDVVVEVHSRQLAAVEAAKLDANSKALAERHAEAVAEKRAPGDNRNIVMMATIEIVPTGSPDPSKEGDTINTNTISKISAIKQNEKQVDPTKAFILWLDLQDPGVWGFTISDELFSPVFTESRNGYAGCGPFWYAFYGRRGDPLLESRGFRYATRPLAHEGRYFQTMKSHGGLSRLSAVMFSMPRSSVLMENPTAVNRLPDRVRAALLKTPNFRLDLSVLDWSSGSASDFVEAQRRLASATCLKLTAFDAASR